MSLASSLGALPSAEHRRRSPPPLGIHQDVEEEVSGAGGAPSGQR